jgi:hypothetical protein
LFGVRNVAQFPLVHVFGFARLNIGASLVQNAFRVHHHTQRGRCAVRKDQAADGDVRRAGADERDLDFVDFLADDF